MGKWGDQVILRERKRQLLSAAAPVISYSPSQDPPTWVHLQVMVRVQVDPLVGLIRGTQIVVNRTQVVVQMQVDPLGQCIQLESTASRGGQTQVVVQVQRDPLGACTTTRERVCSYLKEASRTQNSLTGCSTPPAGAAASLQIGLTCRLGMCYNIVSLGTKEHAV